MSRLGLAALGAAALACGDAGSALRGGEVVRRDSAGIGVVDIPRGALDGLPTRRVATEPRLVVGAIEGRDEEMFGTVSDATMFPDGRLAIADAQQKRILVFGADGAFDRAIGAEGTGPGEFGSIIRIAVIGDTLFVPDLSAFRVQAFTTDGELLGGKTIAGRIGLQMGLDRKRPGRWTAPNVYRIMPGGFPREVPEGDGPHRIMQMMMRYDTLGGRIVGSMEMTPGRYVQLSGEEVQAAMAEGLSHFPVGNVLPHPLAPTPRATFLVDRPVVGWPDIPEILIYTESDDLERIIRFDAAPARVSPDDERYREWAVSFHDHVSRPIQRRAWNVLPRPDAIARFHDVVAGPRGDLWIAVRPEDVEDGQPLWTRWLRLEDDGTPIEWVLTPPLELFELGPDAAVALRKDESGVDRVAVYHYTERGGS